MNTHPKLIAPLLTIIVGIFMVVLDSTAMNVAVYELKNHFHSTLEIVQWTITGYTLAQAAVIPLAGWLSDRYGARRIYITSLVLFVLGSLLCALASSAPQLIVYRILQGLGGGMVLPISTAMIFRIAPREKAGSIMGMVGLPILLAPALGPIVSGYLIDYVRWEWIFLLNLPVGIASILLSLRWIPKFENQPTTSLDKFGILLGPLAFASLTFGISEGGTSWTSGYTVGGIVVGIIALLAFIAVELRMKGQPLLELRVFQSSMFSRGVVTQWLMQFVMFGAIFLIPYYMQLSMGMSAFDAGLWTLPQALSAAVFMPIGGRLYDKIGLRPLIAVGLSAVTVGAILLTHITPADTAIDFLIPRILFGVGMGLSYISLNTYLMQTAPHHLISRVSSLTSAMQQVVSSLAIASLTSTVVMRMDHHIKSGDTLPVATVHSFHDAYWIIVCLAVGAVVLGLTLRKVIFDQTHPSSGEKTVMTE
jgi:EmrB/QacA subfamily drug resistance transporter